MADFRKKLKRVRVGMSVKLMDGDLNDDGEAAVGYSGYAVPGVRGADTFWTTKVRAEALRELGAALEAPEVAEEKDIDPRWDLKSSPEDYLEQYPDGPNAALAREILGLDPAEGDED